MQLKDFIKIFQNLFSAQSNALSDSTAYSYFPPNFFQNQYFLMQTNHT